MAFARRAPSANVAASIKEAAAPEPVEKDGANVPTNFAQLVSTGSTLLDLTISGTRTERGGIPGGIIVEIFGPSGAGKTALLSEIAASTQSQGGHVKFLDPEARLDKEYSEIYGVNVKEHFEYSRPDTVSGMFADDIWGWKSPATNFFNTIAADSLAALSTDLEMDNDDGDKMGMRRAKEFSEGLRKTCRLIAKNNWLIACSNQIRMGTDGKAQPAGGNAVGYYSSLRLQVKPGFPVSKIKKKVKVGAKSKEIEGIIGIYSEVYVFKSSVDIPYRSCPLSIVFGYGIDTIRDELQYYKDMTGDSAYNVFDKTVVGLEAACIYIEQNGLAERLKDRTVGLWNEVQAKFKMTRMRKQR
jgi:RecA/RadA recombinase